MVGITIFSNTLVIVYEGQLISTYWVTSHLNSYILLTSISEVP